MQTGVSKIGREIVLARSVLVGLTFGVFANNKNNIS